jgi:hypothetical protein
MGGPLDIGASLEKIITMQREIYGIHPCLEQLYPIAISAGTELVIFDTDSTGERYHMVTRIPSPAPLPAKLRAAFPLEGYGNRIACVVTPDVFDTMEGYVTIFHEFVHCYQYHGCEQELRRTLQIAHEAESRNDYMWELDYPFPYPDNGFSTRYIALFAALEGKQHDEIRHCRADLKVWLDHGAFEYMVWQEWKEGFARFVENRIQRYLKLPLNNGGSKLPFKRNVFYAGGAKYTQFITDTQPSVAGDLRRLFEIMSI